MKKILNIVGARPNFMKIAPIQRLMKSSAKLTPILLHTGQHYDQQMSDSFFIDLELPQPDRYLGVGSGSHAQQTAAIMKGLEQTMSDLKPDLVLVVGDVNSTLATAIVAAKMQIPIAHVEAGLRSFDRTMPEELNRIITDTLADFLFVSEESGCINLKKEGIVSEKIFLVGNVMIDSLFHFRSKAERSMIMKNLNIANKPYALLTLHRPSNVDSFTIFEKILDALSEIQQRCPVIFPIHPRTKKMIAQFNMGKKIAGMKNLQLVDPLSYLDFLKLMLHATFVLTDSGGIQEETTALSIPCLTLRENTERPSTIAIGTNILVGMNPKRIRTESMKILNNDVKKGEIPPFWDGRTAERIVQILEERL